MLKCGTMPFCSRKLLSMRSLVLQRSTHTQTFVLEHCCHSHMQASYLKEKLQGNVTRTLYMFIFKGTYRYIQ